MKYLCGPPEFQLRGRFLSGCGQAGHSIASSPNDVVATPCGSQPRPDRLSIKRCLQIRLIR
jgi:hypothetical protein